MTLRKAMPPRRSRTEFVQDLLGRHRAIGAKASAESGEFGQLAFERIQGEPEMQGHLCRDACGWAVSRETCNYVPRGVGRADRIVHRCHGISPQVRGPPSWPGMTVAPDPARRTPRSLGRRNAWRRRHARPWRSSGCLIVQASRPREASPPPRLPQLSKEAAAWG